MFCSTQNTERIWTCNFTYKTEKHFKMKSGLESGGVFNYFRKLKDFTKKKATYPPKSVTAVKSPPATEMLVLVFSKSGGRM